ncbi:MAG TPA: bL21 family ribosomal protein [bacterium]|nr:bL21 family ribosomal protein [bacterium]HPL56253.1 bL21 family ribosomal protein [bacterium]
MVSVIDTGGQQYIVTVGKQLQVDKLRAKLGDFVEFKDILNTGKVVKAKVLSDSKGKKINILKFKNKNRYLRRSGHRQDYTIIEITDITTKSFKKVSKAPSKVKNNESSSRKS